MTVAVSSLCDEILGGLETGRTVVNKECGIGQAPVVYVVVAYPSNRPDWLVREFAFDLESAEKKVHERTKDWDDSVVVLTRRYALVDSRGK